MMRFLPAILLAGAAFAQTGTVPSDGPVVGMLNYIHATNHLEKTLAFYHEVFGLDAPAPRPLLSPGVPALTNSPGVKLRLSTRSIFQTPRLVWS